MKASNWLALIGFPLIFFSSTHTYAQSRYAALSSGMDYAEVIRALGTPVDREEREQRREDVWSYPKLKVTFKEGRVVNWNGRKEDSAARSATLVSQKAPAQTNIDPVALEEILSEIMGASGEDDRPGSDVAPGGLPKTFTPPPPVMPVE